MNCVVPIRKERNGKPILKEASLTKDFQNAYLTVFDRLPALMWRAGVDAHCDYFNQSWLAFTGRTIEQELNDGWMEGVHPDDLARNVVMFQDAFQQRLPFEMQYRLRHHSGEYRWILDIGRPIYDPQGNFAGYIGTCFDLTEQKRMEQALVEANQALESTNLALRQREAIFKSLFEQAPNALIGINSAGKIVLVNEQAQSMFGYGVDELTGLQINTLIPELSHDQVYANALDPAWKPANTILSIFARRKDGGVFPVDINLGLLRMENGLLILATIRDITERKKEQEAHYEREKMLTTAATAAPVVFFKIDRQGIIQYSLGQSLARRLDNIDTVGRSMNEVYGKFPQIIHAFEQALAGETVTIVIEAKDLTYEATYAPLQNENGDITGVVGVASDVTRHRKVEEELRKSESHFKTIFDDAILGIKVLDLQGRIVDSNPALQEMLGYTAEELRGKTFLDLTHPADAPMVQRHLNDLMNGRTEHFLLEKRYLHKTGQVIWGRLAMSLFRGSDGQPLYVIGMIENNSAQKQAEAELAEQQRRLADSIEIERLQLAQELHDGPLQELQAMTYQISFLESWIDRPEGQAELHALEKETKKVAQSLRSICGDLRPPALAPFGLERAIRSHAEQFQEQHPELKIHLDLANDGKALPERVRFALFRIYQHSMANILRHAKAHEIKIRFQFDDEQIALQIEDDGQGFRVPKRWIELVREGHYGLVGSIERAESVGGKMDIHASPGNGTRIWVSVPRLEEDQVTPKERLKLSFSSGR